MSSVLAGVIVLAVVVAVFAFMSTRNASFSEIKAALDAGAVVVDVRTAGEFRGGHFEGAVNIPVEQISANIEKLGTPERYIILYCHSGMRSGSAARIVRGAGYKKVVNAGTLGRMKRAAGGS
jgi:phage shock protein E